MIADEDEWTSNAKVHLVGKATAAAMSNLK